FQAEDGIRDGHVTGVQTCALPILPDAGWAVTLARNWPNRPPSASVTVIATNTADVPDDGLRLEITGESVPAFLSSIRTLSGLGRSEERRVGKECRYRWGQHDEKRK